MSASGWLDAFLEMMAVERSAAKNTLAAYSRDLADAQLFLKRLGSDLAKASAEQVEAYFEALGERGASPATASRRCHRTNRWCHRARGRSYGCRRGYATRCRWYYALLIPSASLFPR